MFKFQRNLILPLFLQRQMTIEKLARTAGVNPKTAFRAVNGLPITSNVVDKIARALDFDAINFLENPAQVKDLIL